MAKNKTAKVLGISSIFVGIFIPILGLILSLFGFNKAKNTDERVFNSVGMAVSIISWILNFLFLI